MILLGLAACSVRPAMGTSVTRSRALSLRAPIANEAERRHFQRRLATTLALIFLLAFGRRRSSTIAQPMSMVGNRNPESQGTVRSRERSGDSRTTTTERGDTIAVALDDRAAG